jgi:shikimate kinase
LEGPVAIVGYMGCGKSTVGRMLARSLGWDFVDLDREISRSAGRTIPEIFERCGEEAFRALEHNALLTALDGKRERVVACGGGIVERPENRERLARVPAVFLREDVGILFGRTRDPCAGRAAKISSAATRDASPSTRRSPISRSRFAGGRRKRSRGR